VTFAHPWLLLLAAAPALWALWEWRAAAGRLALLLKACALLAILVALAQPRISVYQTKVAVAILADTSASVTSDDLRTESALADRLERARGRHWTRVTPFARATRNAAPQEHPKSGWSLRHTSGAAGHATNLEAAIRDGAALLPAGLVPRLLLVSDGNENAGSVTRAIWQARQLGIPVDTVSLAGHARPGFILDSVSAPGQVFAGERFPIEVRLQAPRDAHASVNLSAEGRTIASSEVNLTAGVDRLHLDATVNSVGAIALAGEISAQGLGEARFEDAVTLRSPRALLISRDPVSTQTHLAHVLEANQFAVDRAADGVPENLDPYQLIVINNWDAESIPAARQAALEQFVAGGGGLLWIAGERNVYVDQRGRKEDPLDRVLPAKVAPPRKPEGTAVALIIDKSSSMEGKKIELARLAAIGVVQNLRSIDTVGVLVFDNSFQWAVPMRKAEDRDAIARLISGITPDGGTQIAPALTEAYQRILPVSAIYKHIVLLTDGISEEGDSMELAKQALTNRVTISTVGLGQDVNRAFLEKVAQSAEGRSYFLNDPSGLEQILLRDVEEHTGATAVEKPIVPRVAQKAEILDGVPIETVPPLRGYVRFEARPTAETILEVERDPLLVRWQYGLGRAAVFTSDAKNRWAVSWLSWAGFDRLWANIVHDLLPRASASETSAELDRASGQLVVDYRLSRKAAEPSAIPDIFVFGPDGFRAPLPVGKVAAGHYRGRLAIGQHQGLFRIRPVEDSAVFPEVGFYRQEDELMEYGNNEPLLRQISAATGGRFNPSPGQVFNAGSRGAESTMQLWPGLLALALVLNLLELVLRKGKGVWDGLRPRAAERGAESPAAS